MGEASNRKKVRREFRSYTRPPEYKNMKRRVITDKKEIDQIEHEQADDLARVQQEQKEERNRPRWDDATASTLQNEALDNWEPPRSVREFYFLAKRTFPDWHDSQHWKWAQKMFSRHRFIETAVLDGLKAGNDLRERFKAKVGWWWESLGPLSPTEREFVLNFVKRKVAGDLLMSSNPST